MTGTDKRREPLPAALEVYEVEALARACERGEQRAGRTIYDPDELAATARSRSQSTAARLYPRREGCQDWRT